MSILVHIAPPVSAVGGRRAGRLIERNVMVYRRIWMVFFSGFFEPFFYLLAIGFGLGAMIPPVPGPNGPIPYAQFVAPALLASAAMNGAIYDSTFNVFFKLRYAKTYDAMLSTPLGVGDVALGEVAWALMRGSLYALGFLVVILVLGLVTSPWAVLVLPVAMLMGFAFAAVGMAATTFMRDWTDFDWIAVVTLPLFLFSATFYPITVYPEPLRVLVQLSPLYHGTALLRTLTAGAPDLSALGHVGFLVAMGLVGIWIVTRRLDKLLRT
jgi:lipooligosaccharide transport system permease protein